MFIAAKKCSIFGVHEGAYIQCRKTSCFLAFHATCARKHGLLMPMKASCGAEPNTLACYCEKNTILEEQKQYVNEVRLTGVGHEKCTLKTFNIIVVMILAEL